jgi:hypothetical protein
MSRRSKGVTYGVAAATICCLVIMGLYGFRRLRGANGAEWVGRATNVPLFIDCAFWEVSPSLSNRAIDMLSTKSFDPLTRSEAEVFVPDIEPASDHVFYLVRAVHTVPLIPFRRPKRAQRTAEYEKGIVYTTCYYDGTESRGLIVKAPLVVMLPSTSVVNEVHVRLLGME